MKFVFILPSQANTNHIKRIEEFVHRGYEVEVYTFYRDKNRKNTTDVVSFHNIGEFSNDLPYLKRLKFMYKGIRIVLNETRDTNCIYYLMRNDIALIFTAISSKRYIFEEADMTHIEFNNSILRNYLEKRICKIINKSILSVFRSEGFIDYHFRDKKPDNAYVIPNRLHPAINTLKALESSETNIKALKIGFVGSIRYDSIFNIANVVLSNFPKHEFHFYGIFASEKERIRFGQLSSFKNCFFHGEFKSPDELPQIYSQIDLVVSAYDNRKVNVRYAEPNKLYEAIYFETPIVVSNSTFLARKVERMKIGFVVNPFDNDSILSFIKGLSLESIAEKKEAMKLVPKGSLINSNEDFFRIIDDKLCRIE